MLLITMLSYTSVSDISRDYQLDPSSLCCEWVAFSKQNDDCNLDSENIERFIFSVHSKSKSHKTPSSRHGVSRTRGIGQRMSTKDDIGNM